MPKVKFFGAGRWADKPYMPQIEVKAGEVVEVSADLMMVVIESGKGEMVIDQDKETTDEEETAPAENNLEEKKPGKKGGKGKAAPPQKDKDKADNG